jgi:hypothetical protein
MGMTETASALTGLSDTSRGIPPGTNWSDEMNKEYDRARGGEKPW